MLIIDPKEQIAWFAERKPEDLAEWFYAAFVEEDPAPLEFDLSRATLFAYVISRTKGLSGKSLKNLKRAIELAVFDWRQDSFESNARKGFQYLEFLISLSWRLQVHSLLPSFVTWLVSRRFESLQMEDNFLQLSLLRAVLAFGLRDKGVIALCKNYIYDYRYASYCYRSLWYRDPNNAIRYFTIMAQLHMRYGENFVGFPQFFMEISKQFEPIELITKLRKELRKCKDVLLRIHIKEVLGQFQWVVYFLPGSIIILPPPELMSEKPISDYFPSRISVSIDSLSKEEEVISVETRVQYCLSPDRVENIWAASSI